jgi:dipeptidyl aminopeptidase/acylaminoacyl peptidase
MTPMLFRMLLTAVLAAGFAPAADLDHPVRTEQFGAVRTDFDVAGRRGFVIMPAKPGASRPWVWYAPTLIGRYPAPRHSWLAGRLLEAGFAIAGMDVGESWGNAEGRRMFSEFYKTAVSAFGLSGKACLLAQSRGGLMLYNWAAENPGKVQCIGGIYPVCAIGNRVTRKEILEAYGMTESEMAAHSADNSPIERLKPLAAARVPILLLHGDRDNVVPLEENSAELVRRYKALGGDAELVVIGGKGHEEVDEFFESQRLPDFFLTRGK